VASVLARVYRAESGKLLAKLIHGLGDFERADEALQDACAEALAHWPAEGLPDRPGAWLMTVAKRKAIEALRHDSILPTSEFDESISSDPAAVIQHRLDSSIEDERLRLIFTCCHPALAREAQVGLTLRSLCGLRPAEIAEAFLVSEAALEQRLVRARRKIREAAIPFRVPPDHLLGERTETVLHVLYLIFNEGYDASGGDELVRSELCEEALRLARLLTELMPGESEAHGLLALMLLQDSRREARSDAAGDIILLEDQDRSLWKQAPIREGLRIVEHWLKASTPGPYLLQAAIAATHAQAKQPQATQWDQIVALYDLLLRASPSPVIELNRAAAVAMHEGPTEGLRALDDIAQQRALDEYLYYHALRADLYRRLGRATAARSAYDRALACASNASEKRFLNRRLDELSK